MCCRSLCVFVCRTTKDSHNLEGRHFMILNRVVRQNARNRCSLQWNKKKKTRRQTNRTGFYSGVSLSREHSTVITKKRSTVNGKKQILWPKCKYAHIEHILCSARTRWIESARMTQATNKNWAKQKKIWETRTPNNSADAFHILELQCCFHWWYKIYTVHTVDIHNIFSANHSDFVQFFFGGFAIYIRCSIYFAGVWALAKRFARCISMRHTHERTSDCTE